MNWRQIFATWLRIGFYGSCALCQRPAVDVFCRDCLHQLQVCHGGNPKVIKQAPVPVLAWGIYTGLLKRAIALLKYEQQPQIARPFGKWLGQTWLQHHGTAGKCIVVPIPLHRDRQLRRGYNQAELIAQSFCQFTGLPLRRQGLVRLRNTAAQFSLTVAQRRQNVESAFCLGPDLQRQRSKCPILLLDDIYTTGATAYSAAQTLQLSGMVVQEVVTVAQAQRAKPNA